MSSFSDLVMARIKELEKEKVKTQSKIDLGLNLKRHMDSIVEQINDNEILLKKLTNA